MVLAGGPMSNLSGKPTFLSVLLNDSWMAAYDPKGSIVGSKTYRVDLNLETFIGLAILLVPRFNRLKIYRSNCDLFLASFIYENSNWRLPSPFGVDLIAQTLIKTTGYVVIICIA